MKANEAAKLVVSLAQDQIGYKEEANNWNKYASMPELTTLYGWSLQNQPWCAVFVNWLFITAFGYDIGTGMTYGGSPACAVQAGYYINNNAFVSVPEVGDQFFQTIDGGINHTGIVAEVYDDRFVTVEGNYSDGVYSVTHRLSDPDVAGFGRPKWELIENATEHGDYEDVLDPYWKECKDDSCEIDFNTTTVELPLLGIGSAGYSVKVLQALLVGFGYSVGYYGVDGDFGVCTLIAVKQYQKDNGLVADGSVGRLTWKKILEGG